MTEEPARKALAHRAASTILNGFDSFRYEFKAVTRRARIRFEERDWHGMVSDAAARLDVYTTTVDQVVKKVRSLLADDFHEPALWEQAKAVYARSIADYANAELAETFFNSVTRRIFSTVGVDSRIEFVEPRPEEEPRPGQRSGMSTFVASGRTVELVEDILTHYPFAARYEDLRRDAARTAGAVEERCRAAWGAPRLSEIDMLDAVFYRGQSAYLIGRVRRAYRTLPLVVVLRHAETGIHVDAALLTEDEASIVFSFTRSYFHVDVEQPALLIRFLHSIMPRKRIAELYTALGFNKHGKTELFRDLLRHLDRSTDRFQIAPGDRGLVMVVFTLPSYDVVFKVIRDRFPEPKRITRNEVVQKYDLVFKRDRAGRLVDAQEFEHLTFEQERFSPELLEELRDSASENVRINGDVVDIRHLYTERRLAPLNLYLRQADEESARAAVLDYGQAIKDLAASNIFPGDLLTKNFGVTRHGRVVFYDYDELCLLSSCNFRDLPEPRDDFEVMRSEPWYYVGPDDVFPEEFPSFLGLPKPLREVFCAAHSELFDPAYWRGIQQRHKAGELIEIAPYPPQRRLGAE